MNERRLVVLALALLLTAAALAAGAGSRSASPRLKFDPAMGQTLPWRGNVVSVMVDCAGANSCSGRLIIRPADSATRQLTGNVPIASARIKVGKGSTDLSPRLSPRAKRALDRDRALHVIATLRPSSDSIRVSIGSETAFRGHPKPNSVHVNHPGGSGGGTIKEFTWKWNIPARSYLLVPGFKCPDDARYIATNGKGIVGIRNTVVGKVGRLDLNAGEGAGYAKFDDPDLRYADGDGRRIMLGWPTGSAWRNSIWAPLTSSVRVELHAWCTDDFSNPAYIDDKYVSPNHHETALFPWGKY